MRTCEGAQDEDQLKVIVGFKINILFNVHFNVLPELIVSVLLKNRFTHAVLQSVVSKFIYIKYECSVFTILNFVQL